MKQVAFTLAETLVTIGIIGVVAAMTLPSVISDIQDKQFKAAFKKQFSIISQAFLMVYQEDGEEIKFGEWSDMVFYVCKVGEKMHYVGSGLKCDEILSMSKGDTYNNHKRTNITWHADQKWYTKQNKPTGLNQGYTSMTFQLADGAMVNFNCLRQIFVDVNGLKKPNTIGRDIFYFTIPEKSATPSFWKDGKQTNVNLCSGKEAALITKDNYEEDCKSGSGWGCSPLYILD